MFEFLISEEGQSIVEYTLLVAALVTAVIIAFFGLFANSCPSDPKSFGCSFEKPILLLPTPDGHWEKFQ